MAALVILVAMVLLAALVAVVTSVLGIPITFRRQTQRPARPAAVPGSSAARATARLLLALVVISVTGAVLLTLALHWLGGLLERLSA